jgi:hypothetical protein
MPENHIQVSLCVSVSRSINGLRGEGNQPVIPDRVPRTARFGASECSKLIRCACKSFGISVHELGERSSAGTAGAGVSVETGRRVKVTESIADRAAPAVDQPHLVPPSLGVAAATMQIMIRV